MAFLAARDELMEMEDFPKRVDEMNETELKIAKIAQELCGTMQFIFTQLLDVVNHGRITQWDEKQLCELILGECGN
jgi:predicted Rossmann fold nucleotide-binding protein DprA/Smf involved in DNA uptake